MLRSVIAGLFLIGLLAIYDVSNAQVRNIVPYLGASGSVGPGGFGWGLEAGIRFFTFYTGIEEGAYTPLPRTGEPVIGHIPDPWIVSVQFWGVHAGYVFRVFTYLGIVVLRNSEQWNVPKGDTSYMVTTRNNFDFGPDFRYSGLADGHLYLAFALTYRRGLKAGLGYMF